MNRKGLIRIGAPLLELLLVLLCLLLLGQPVQASAPPVERSAALFDFDFDFDETPLWQEPVLYSLRLMGLGFTGMVGLNLSEGHPRLENFREVWNSPAPKPDDDGPLFNFLLNPLWGSETYLRARDAGMDSQDSFVFSMTASMAWEYLIRAWAEHPSSQDLAYTTGIGWVLGEGRYQLLETLDDEQKLWADPLRGLVNTLDLSAQLDTDGRLIPILGMGWDF